MLIDLVKNKGIAISHTWLFGGKNDIHRKDKVVVSDKETCGRYYRFSKRSEKK